MTTISEIQEKIDKCEIDIQKKMDRIAKLEQKEIRLKRQLENMGCIFEDYDKFERSRYAKKPNSYGHYDYNENFSVANHITNWYDVRDNHEIWVTELDLEDCITAQLSSWNKIFELEDKITRFKTQLQKLQVRNDEIEEMPPIFKELKDAIYEEIVDIYKNAKEETTKAVERAIHNRTFRTEIMQELYSKIGKGLVQFVRFRTVEELTKIAEKDAEDYILNLIGRVTKYVGKITDYSDIVLTGPSINGIIEGENGKVSVRTVVAGGYNIQTLHNRVLVKRI